jgi:hypothetical protein
MPQTFTSPFTGNVINPTDVSYYELTFSTDQDLYWPAVVNPTQVPAARIMDCYPEAADLHINLPQGNQGSVGSDILFRNFGGQTFSIVDFSGVSSVLIAPGESKYFYLSNNDTEEGVWQNVTFGTGTSTADAATLQGAGLTTLSGKLAVTGNIIEVSAPPTFTDASRAATYVWTSGVGTFTMPAAVTLTSGWFIGFRNNGTGTLTIAATGISQINGESTLTVNPGDSGYLIFQISTGNFFTVGSANPGSVTFTSATYDVDSIIGSSLNLAGYAPVIQTYVSLTGTRTIDLDVTLPAITQIYILLNETGSSSYNINFSVSGSGSPPFVLTAGSIVIMLSDGNTLFPLSQTTTSIFYAINGSENLPSFSFINDINSGMYLNGTSILGLSAGTRTMILMDNSNTLAPIVNVDATLQANLINGGTF